MIIRSRNPKVLEYSFAELDTYVTSPDQFYVRNHFPEPAIDIKSWRLKVDGCVMHPLELAYNQLLEMPGRTLIATLECAGNNRVFLDPPVDGVQWGLGGISNAEWTGVPLATVLKRAGIKPEAVDVIIEGADSGEVPKEPKPVGAIHFARSLPVDKAMDDDVLLCYRMNGSELPQAHGYPLRAIVPGWYAMASVKWVKRISVTERPFKGYFQTTDYAYWEMRDEQAVRTPISRMLVKAEIARPSPHEIIPQCTDYRVAGAAWAGESNIAAVDVSTDGGRTWTKAKLLGEPVVNAWRFFEYLWNTPSSPGSYSLVARATDEQGNTQPMAHDLNRGGYMINCCMPVAVEVV